MGTIVMVTSSNFAGMFPPFSVLIRNFPFFVACDDDYFCISTFFPFTMFFHCEFFHRWMSLRFCQQDYCAVFNTNCGNINSLKCAIGCDSPHSNVKCLKFFVILCATSFFWELIEIHTQIGLWLLRLLEEPCPVESSLNCRDSKAAPHINLCILPLYLPYGISTSVQCFASISICV